MELAARPLEIFFIPFLSPGHLIPLSEMARLFAAQGQHVTIITTPANAALIRNSIDKDAASGHHISIHLVSFPSQQAGLPDGLENFFSATDVSTAGKLYYGLTLLWHSIEHFIDTARPDCIVSDMFFPWAADTAVRHRIPRLVFQSLCMFAQSLKDAVRRPDSPHHKAESDYHPFVIPGLPDPITMTRSQLPDYIRTPNGYTQLNEEWREAELKSYGVVVNNFYELDPAYTEHYKRVMGNDKVFNIGPAAMIHRSAAEKIERSHDTVVGEHECLSWLNPKKPDSVLYVCFGSACKFPDEQLMEIACGLEASGHDFIWVVHGKDDDDDDKREKWLPKGFDEKITGRGLIVRGWAPQLLILDHPSVGGFVTHCGWNSVIEGVSAGVPMVTWPLYAEQFYNEKLLTQVLGIGVETGVEDWSMWVDAGKKVIKRDRVERAVRKVMDGGDEAMEMKRKVRELEVKAKRAVEKSGSSHRNLSVLIQELKQLRDDKNIVW